MKLDQLRNLIKLVENSCKSIDENISIHKHLNLNKECDLVTSFSLTINKHKGTKLPYNPISILDELDICNILNKIGLFHNSEFYDLVNYDKRITIFIFYKLKKEYI